MSRKPVLPAGIERIDGWLAIGEYRFLDIGTALDYLRDRGPAAHGGETAGLERQPKPNQKPLAREDRGVHASWHHRLGRSGPG